MPRTAASPSSSTALLALSSLHTRHQTLEKEHQWLLKQIKRKQTELKNFVEQMRSVATEIFQRGNPSFNKLVALDLEIHALFAEILTTRKLGKQASTGRRELSYYLSNQLERRKVVCHA